MLKNERLEQLGCNVLKEAFGYMYGNVVCTAMFAMICNENEQSIRLRTTNNGHEVFEGRWIIVIDSLWKCLSGHSSKRYETLVPSGDRCVKLAQERPALYASDTSS